MLGASQVTDRGHKDVPTAIHVDGTARPKASPDFAEPVWGILNRFQAQGEHPVLINTSFDTRGDPIVDTADGALRSARTIGLDFVVSGDRLIDRLLSEGNVCLRERRKVTQGY